MHCWSDRSPRRDPRGSVSSASLSPASPGSLAAPAGRRLGLGRGRPPSVPPCPEAEAAPHPSLFPPGPPSPREARPGTSGELDSPGHADWGLAPAGKQGPSSQLPVVGRPCEPSPRLHAGTLGLC